MKACSNSREAPLVLYVSKMVAVPASALPRCVCQGGRGACWFFMPARLWHCVPVHCLGWCAVRGGLGGALRGGVMLGVNRPCLWYESPEAVSPTLCRGGQKEGLPAQGLGNVLGGMKRRGHQRKRAAVVRQTAGTVVGKARSGRASLGLLGRPPHLRNTHACTPGGAAKWRPLGARTLMAPLIAAPGPCLCRPWACSLALQAARRARAPQPSGGALPSFWARVCGSGAPGADRPGECMQGGVCSTQEAAACRVGGAGRGAAQRVAWGRHAPHGVLVCV